MYEHFFKRLIDVVLSALGLLLLSWLFLLIAIAILIDDPGPVMFKQNRYGKNKVFFLIHKFRSMKTETPDDISTSLLENPDQYITRVGKLLRKSSLDELPQLWDIFRGKMSIIGPRPVLGNAYELELINERDKYGANDVKPGLTGWAQVNGRDLVDTPHKAQLDGEYVAILKAGGFRAFWFDVKCFFKTVLSVLKSEGIMEGNIEEYKTEIEEKESRGDSKKDD